MNVLLTASLLFSAASAAGQDRQVTVDADGMSRSYFVHVPASYNGSEPYPLVLVFHGGYRDAQSTVDFVGMNAVADAKHFIVAYPQGLPLPHSPSQRHLFWNCSDSAFTSDADDVAFTEVVLDDLESKWRVDTRRVFATGMSAGAQMSYRLACGRLSSRLAAIASVSGSLETSPCQPERPVPILEFHGTADRFIPYDGGGSLGYQSVPDTIDAWLALDQCPTVPTTEDLGSSATDGTSVSRLTYGPCAGGAEVQLVKINGSGHNWPGIPLEPNYPMLMGEKVIGRVNWHTQRNLLGTVTSVIYAPDMIWDFFQRHPLPE